MATARLATASDIDVLVELMREFYAEAGLELDGQWAARAFADLIATPERGAVWVMAVDGVVVGHCVLSVRFAMEFGGLSGAIDDLFVRVSYRRRGAATAGLDALVADCRRRECRSLHVEVDPANTAALALYRRLGLAAGADERLQLKMEMPPRARIIGDATTVPSNDHERFLKQAIALAADARAAGNHPFGALLTLDGEVVLSAMNTAATERDPTAHAETNLVAEAIRRLSRDEIRRAVLYTSCEPCAMCVGKMYWAGVRAVVFGLSSAELAVMAGADFLIPCRDLFEHAAEKVKVVGPLLTQEARAVHAGFWS